MKLDGIMFDHLIFNPFAVTVRCVWVKESVHSHISNDVVMYEVVKGDVFEFIELGHTKNWILLCKSRQDWFYFVATYKTQIPHTNVMKKVQWEGIELFAIFGGTRMFIQATGRFKGGWVV